MTRHRCIVVGAGPAGIRCAQVLHAAGIDVTLIDENLRGGGQIYRQQPAGFERSYGELYGREAKRARAIHELAAGLFEAIDYRPGTTVWNIAGSEVYTSDRHGHDALPFDSLVLCTGATDRIMPTKGWQIAGTFSLGGAQIALKSQACAIGRRVVFAGTGALLYLTASQYVRAGANVAAVLDTSSWTRRLSALPALLAQPALAWTGVLLTMRLLRAGVSIHTGVELTEIAGSRDSVHAVEYRAGDTVRSVSCDAVALGYHVRPETQLADLAGCRLEFDPDTRLWLPAVDQDGRSSVAGVYLAGDGVTVLGAHAAEDAGRLTALAVLQDNGVSVEERDIAKRRRRLTQYRRFAQGLRRAFPWPANAAGRLNNDTIVCRCEGIDAGELRQSLQSTGATEINRVKSFCRVGMGRCQGRYCADAAAEIVSAASNVPLESVGRLRSQAPAKPISIGSARNSHD